MVTLADRFKTSFNPEVQTQADLARAAKVSSAAVADWFSGKTKTLKAEPHVRAARYLNVKEFWLATGEGPMRGPEREGTVPYAVLSPRPEPTRLEIRQEPVRPRLVDWPIPNMTVEQVHERLSETQRGLVTSLVQAFLDTTAAAETNKAARRKPQQIRR